MRNRAIILAFAAGVGSACLPGEPVHGQFVPGHVFLQDGSNNFCEADKFGVPFDKEYIYEVNPETGEQKVFAIIPRDLCGVTSGLAFSPDGKRLRVASMMLSTIFEFDSQGHRSVALDWRDGIAGPVGCNCIAYDRAGNFYVSNYGGLPNVMRFPADGGPGEIIAPHDSNGVHVHGPTSLAVTREGTVYVVNDAETHHVLRITPEGEVSVFDVYTRYNEVALSVTVDDVGTVYVLTNTATSTPVYRYARGISGSRETLIECSLGNPAFCDPLTVCMSADGTQLLGMAGRNVLFLDLNDLSVARLSLIPGASRCGLAVVPLRGDVDGDDATNLDDLETMIGCLGGPGSALADPACDRADLDADGDVDLFDVRFFFWAHSIGQ